MPALEERVDVVRHEACEEEIATLALSLFDENRGELLRAPGFEEEFVTVEKPGCERCDRFVPVPLGRELMGSFARRFSEATIP